MTEASHGALSSLWSICIPHQARNREIHANAMRLLQLGQDLPTVVRYCRKSYRAASEQYRAQNDRDHNITSAVRRTLDERYLDLDL